jgi:hypothetical protein
MAECCPTLKIAMKAALAIAMWGRCKAPQPWCCGALVVTAPVVVGEVPVLRVGDFGDGGAGGVWKAPPFPDCGNRVF